VRAAGAAAALSSSVGNKAAPHPTAHGDIPVATYTNIDVPSSLQAPGPRQIAP
jgi:hypothetical protein